MTPLHPQYVADENGQKKSVLLPVGEWEAVLEALEELEDIRAYDEAKQAPTDAVPFPDR